MAVHRPRKPSKQPKRKLTVSMDSSVRRAENPAQKLANRLAKEYAEALKKAKAEQARNQRSASSQAGRGRRQASVQDTFAPQADQPVQDTFSDTAQDTFAQDLAEELLPPGLAAEEDWESFGTPDVEAPSASEYYSPTRSINPPRPRTREMSYNRQTRTLRVVYRDGGTYEYFNVPGPIWYRIRQVRSPGRFIDRNIKGVYAYERVGG